MELRNHGSTALSAGDATIARQAAVEWPTTESPSSASRAAVPSGWATSAAESIAGGRATFLADSSNAMRPDSLVAPDWWDYTTLDAQLLDDAARLTADDLLGLSREGFEVRFYDTLEDFYLAEALEYIHAWRQATADQPAGICGPIGPTEQLPLVARLVNELQLDLRHAHFWGMDEWVLAGREVSEDHPLSFARADRQLCFDRIRPDLVMPEAQIHFPKADVRPYVESWQGVRCVVMQGGQGEVKHWAFNDPPRREGKWQDEPPPPEEYRKLGTRVVELHPMTVIQNARTSGGGVVTSVPTQAVTVGPVETWRAEKVSIWHAGQHDNPFGMRLTTLMISQRIADTSVPMSLLADHPRVQFNFYRGGIGTCEVEMH
jgi:glucosamine-6-phosphate deaminase